ncbi:conjugative transfer signal peptidase TraF [Maridesulfovibrio frigidus]|uniref:conjugative transfer signal peptidase TraF n=1 Tax=Maridesulfovibrio frigidus TaxID=340956 RepID=UPI000A96848A|nr:conjugative transfer signal peptidase TraF [Maridesulfovibrio frigidus]
MKKIILLAFCCHLTAIIYAIHFAGYRVNFTDSMPHGIYQIIPGKPAKGDLVTFSLREDNPYFKISLDRKYLGHYGKRPLLKTLAGTTGDNVEVTLEGININGLILSSSLLKNHDNHGRNLPSLLTSNLIPQGKALVMSTHTEGSFDSRYFGLVDAKEMQRVIPILTFNLEDRTITESKNTCPKCGTHLTQLSRSNGCKSMWICSSYPACHYWTSNPEEYSASSIEGNLTTQKIEETKPKQKLYRITDSNGLCLEVRPTGSKLWRFRYRFNGKEKMIGLGSFPATSLNDARNKRDEHRKTLEKEIDPSRQRQEQRSSIKEAQEQSHLVGKIDSLIRQLRKSKKALTITS